MERTEFMDLPFAENSRYTMLLALAVQAWPLGGESLGKRWQEVILGFARWLGQQKFNEGDLHLRQQMLLRCIQALSRRAGGVTAVQVFVSTVLSVWRQWPDFGSALDPFLPLLLSLPADQLAQSWP